MTALKDLLSLGFYKKTCYFGSDGSMRYKIEKKDDSFLLTTWKGPFAFDTTSEEKTTFEAPFSEDGLKEVCDEINRRACSY